MNEQIERLCQIINLKSVVLTFESQKLEYLFGQQWRFLLLDCNGYGYEFINTNNYNNDIDKKRWFLTTLFNTNSNALLMELVEVLLHTGQDQAACLLDPTVIDLADLTRCDPRNGHCEKFSFNEPNPIEKLNERNDLIKMNSNAYSMNANPRGFCYILNNYFTMGTYKEMQRFRNIFNELKFDVIMRKNLEAKEVTNDLFRISKRDELKNHDAFIFMNLSYGNCNEEILGFDGKTIKVTNLLNMFNKDNCHYLNRKPKIFFFNCCRGSNKDNLASKLSDKSDFGLNESVANIAKNSDLFISYSNLEGYFAQINWSKGTYFGRLLADSFVEMCNYKDLIGIIGRANEKLREIIYKLQEGKENGKRDPISIIKKASRDVYFCQEIYASDLLAYFENYHITLNSDEIVRMGDYEKDSYMNTFRAPLQIVNKDFELNKESLSKVFGDKSISNRPVSIISIAGLTRTGKSFMLNLMLRFLEGPDSFEKNKTKIEQYFKSKSGNTAETTGIWMWPKAFNLPGIPTPILLMDTAGVYGQNTNIEIASKVFTLSMLMSSIQVYNISRNLKENDLEMLHIFTEYGRQANQKSLHQKRPFHHLKFLIRDWPPSKEYAFGGTDGERFIADYLDEKNESKNNVRAHIYKCFDKITCFLLPYPGTKVNCGDFSNIDDIDDTCKTFLLEFLKDLFTISNIVPKEICGQEINASDLLAYFENYHITLNSDEITRPVSMLEATRKTANQISVKKSFQIYEAEMNLNIKKFDGKVLTRNHEQALNKALKFFMSYPKYGELEDSIEYMEQLLARTSQLFSATLKIVEDNKKTIKIKIEGAVQKAFSNYQLNMDKNFGLRRSDEMKLINFDEFYAKEDCFNKESIQLFRSEVDSEFEDLNKKYEIILKEKIEFHCKSLATTLWKKSSQIDKHNENRISEAQKLYDESIEKYITENNLEKYKQQMWLENYHNILKNNIIAEHFANLESENNLILIFENYCNLKFEKYKRQIISELINADEICLEKLEEAKAWYTSQISEYLYLNEIREKHELIFDEAKIKFYKSVSEANTKYEQFSKKYDELIDLDLKKIHDKLISRSYLFETCDNPEFEHVKIIVVGDKSVGKSSLVERFTKNQFISKGKFERGIFEATPDIVARITTVQNRRSWLKFWDSKRVRVSLWDTCCKSGERNLTQNYYINAEGIVIVFDVTNATSLLSLAEWIININKSNSKAEILIIANKIDDKTKKHVTNQEIKRILQPFRMPYKEVSAKKGLNVDAAFEELASIIMTNKRTCVIS